MSEVLNLPDSRSKLLLADARLSLAALQRSLSEGAPTGGEAWLHVTDLSGLISVLGLKAEAESLQNLARRLSEDSFGVLDLAREVLAQLQGLVDALQTGDSAALQAARQSLATSMKQPAAPEPDQPPAATPAITPPPAKPTGLAQTHGHWRESSPHFSQGLVAQGLVAQGQAAMPEAAAMPPAAPPTPYQPSWTQVRAQAIHSVQEAGALLETQQHPAAGQALLKLSVAQDQLVRVGQLPMRQVYPQGVGMDDVWADAEVIDLLEHLQVFAQRASRTSAQVRNLTLFLTWHGATLSQSELEHVGHKVGEAQGRAELAQDGVLLVLPVSTQRMRMVSYRLAGQWLAISAAQFLGWDSAPASAMKLRCGTHSLTLAVDEAGNASHMNIYPWPASVPAPLDVRGVALDGTGRVHLVRPPQP